MGKIGSYAFSYCTGLKTINLESIKGIGDSAFTQCVNIEEVTLPKDIEKATIIKRIILEQTEAQKIKFINDPPPQQN